MGDHLTTTDAARFVGVSDTSLRNFARDGKLHPVRVGAYQDMWERAELERLKEQRDAERGSR